MTTGFHTADIPHPSAREAVTRSMRQTEIVTLTPDTAAEAAEICRALKVACEDSAAVHDSRGHVTEFWGTDEDGDEWRVHVVTIDES